MPLPVERYLNVRQAYAPAFAADGRQLAFLTDITGIPQVWSVPMGRDEAVSGASDIARWPDQLTFEPDPVSDVRFSPVQGDSRLLYTRDVGGNENLQIFLLDLTTGVSVCLNSGHERAMHLFGDWSRDGKALCFAANRRDPMLYDLYVQALPAALGSETDGDGLPEDEEARLMWQNDTPGYLYDIRFSPDGRHVVATRTSSSFDHTLLEVDLATGTAWTLLVSDGNARYYGARYTPDGNALYLITDVGSAAEGVSDDPEFLYVARVDLKSGELDRLLSPAWDCGSLALSGDGARLAYTVNVEGADRVFILDLNTWQSTPAPEFADAPGVVPDGKLVFSPDGNSLAFAFSSATRTTDIYVWDLARHAVRAVTRSSHGGLPLASFIEPELIHYPTFDTDEEGEVREIPAWFYRAPGDSPAPVVVIVHGGPESQFRPSFNFLAQYLLQSGYAVLAPNVRGSTGYGKRYSHLDDVELRMDSVADLACAAEWLRSRSDVDESRLVVYGGSYGGFMVLAALTTYPDLWAAGVDIVGISNLATFLENTSAYRRGHREAEYGSLARDRGFLERIAPINHVERIAAPLMVIHGANDPRVPLSEAQQLVAALERREVPVSFLVFDDEGHGIVRLKNKRVAYPAIVEFLRTHVG